MIQSSHKKQREHRKEREYKDLDNVLKYRGQAKVVQDESDFEDFVQKKIWFKFQKHYTTFQMKGLKTRRKK